MNSTRILSLPREMSLLHAEWPVALMVGGEILVDSSARRLPLVGEFLLNDKLGKSFETELLQVGQIYFMELRNLEIDDARFSRVTSRGALDLAQDALPEFLRGLQLIQWFSQTKFCASCGLHLKLSSEEFAKICSVCSKNYYPTISPAVIGVILKKRLGRQSQILLAKGLAPRKFYSCIAGFVEAGETLEEAFRREVLEEVGLHVGAIHYFGSQPWPFPSQLMVGFIGEWQSGEIKINRSELTDAAWFDGHCLPELPPSISISRQIIDYAVAQMPI